MRILLATILLVSVGCSSLAYRPVATPAPPALVTVKPDLAALLTPGVTIRAADGSFVIKEGQAIQAPFHSGAPAYGLKRIIKMSDDFAELGAKRVFIDYPGEDKPIYGLLALLPVYESADSASQRVFRIQVPKARVEQARGGLLHVIYQNYSYKGPSTVSVAIGVGGIVGPNARQAGLQRGDHIIKYNGQLIASTSAFLGMVKRTSPSTKVQIQVQRAGQMLNLTANGGYLGMQFGANKIHQVNSSNQAASWILWISDAPFAGHDFK